MCDAPELAAAVRSLATRSHRVMNDPLADPEAYDLLSKRIARLSRRYAIDPQSSIGRWLASLSHKVESAMPRAALCSNR